MKKSFKKAGAAVLSMAMLLSMGAISMPVYAVDPVTHAPGQIEVKLNTNFADDGVGTVDWTQQDPQQNKNHKYDYIPEIKNATVKLYRVATLDQGGWSWDIPGMTTGTLTGTDMNGDAIDLAKFEDLLRTVALSETSEIPSPTSTQMLSLASQLERLILQNNTVAAQSDSTTSAIDPIASGTISSKYDILRLPTDANLYKNDGTKNVIGYYLIQTDTSDSGVFVQPALIVLKNDELENDKYIKEVSLKGYSLDVDKSIEEVKDKTVKADISGSSTTPLSSVSGSKDTAVVATNDKIKYQIKSALPRYDVNVLPANINDFVLVDTPDAGIKLLDQEGNTATMKTGLDSGDVYQVLWCATDSDTPSDWTTLTGATLTTLPYGVTKSDSTNDDASGKKKVKYTVANATTDGTIGNGGFMVAVPGSVLKEKNGGYIKIVFYGEVDDTKLNKGYSAVTPDKTNATLTTEDYAAAKAESLEAIGISRMPGVAAADNDAWLKIVKENPYIVAALELTGSETADEIKTKATNYRTAGNTAAGSLDSGATDAQLYKDVAQLVAALRVANDAIHAANDAAKESNGSKNVVNATYGNDFATGGGKGEGDDTTIVFTASLDLDKVAENITLSNDETKENVTQSTEEVKLANAVFKLEKNYNEADTAKTSAPTYAVTTLSKDASNNDVTTLVYLTETTYTPGTEGVEGTWSPAIPSGAQTYEWTEKVDGTDVKHTAFYDPNNMVKAWNALKIGEYTLTEVKSPAGYKKWDNPVKFVVSATSDSTNDFTGEFSANSSATDNNKYASVAKDLRTTDEKTEGNDAYIANPLYFRYNTTTGELETTVKDELADALPATGGMGTVLFTAGGISIVLIAGALFVMYMKKRNAEDEE